MSDGDSTTKASEIVVGTQLLWRGRRFSRAVGLEAREERARLALLLFGRRLLLQSRIRSRIWSELYSGVYHGTIGPSVVIRRLVV